jgi:hypothetical protein
MEVGHDLTNPVGVQGEPAVDVPYPQLLGALMYVMVCTRPDISFPISILSRFMAEGRHTSAHWKAAKRVLQYLKGTKNWSLTLGGKHTSKLVGYCDSSWADDKTSQRSSLGYCFQLGSGAISWKSKMSDCVALSSAEAEYYAGALAVSEGRWLVNLLKELGYEVTPYELWCDSQSAMGIMKNPIISARSKHISVKYAFIRDDVEAKALKLAYIPSSENVADSFTKALPFEKHSKFAKALLST